MSKEISTEQLKKEIVIERLRQTPLNFKVSFGMSDGKFMNRDDLIRNIEGDTDIGKRVVQIQLAYLKAFRAGALFLKWDVSCSLVPLMTIL